MQLSPAFVYWVPGSANSKNKGIHCLTCPRKVASSSPNFTLFINSRAMAMLRTLHTIPEACRTEWQTRSDPCWEHF